MRGWLLSIRPGFMVRIVACQQNVPSIKMFKSTLSIISSQKMKNGSLIQPNLGSNMILLILFIVNLGMNRLLMLPRTVTYERYP
jgi:hypothetical protein